MQTGIIHAKLGFIDVLLDEGFGQSKEGALNSHLPLVTWVAGGQR